MKNILLLSLLISASAIAADVSFTVTTTTEHQTAVAGLAQRLNKKAIELFIQQHPGVILSTNGPAVTGTVDGTPVGGTVVLKTVLSYGQEICVKALDDKKAEYLTIIRQEADTKMQELAAAFKAAPPGVQAAIREALGILP